MVTQYAIHASITSDYIYMMYIYMMYIYICYHARPKYNRELWNRQVCPKATKHPSVLIQNPSHGSHPTFVPLTGNKTLFETFNACFHLPQNATETELKCQTCAASDSHMACHFHPLNHAPCETHPTLCSLYVAPRARTNTHHRPNIGQVPRRRCQTKGLALKLGCSKFPLVGQQYNNGNT